MINVTLEQFILFLFIIVFIAIIFHSYFNNEIKEGYNEQNGQFCTTCKGKTPNQCMKCFNCGWCVDRWGNAGCIGGDANSGPYNYERCMSWYHTDPYVLMKQRNANYKCSYGPRSSNRIIGV